MPKTVIAGVDGSDESGNALRWAADYVDQVGGVLHAITVWHQPVQFGYRLATPDSELKQRAQSTLDAAVRPVREQYPNVDLKGRLIRGDDVDELVRLSEQADLMAVGNKGHSAFTSMMVGSVAMRLVQHAHCPVIVVR